MIPVGRISRAGHRPDRRNPPPCAQHVTSRRGGLRCESGPCWPILAINAPGNVAGRCANFHLNARRSSPTDGGALPRPACGESFHALSRTLMDETCLLRAHSNTSPRLRGEVGAKRRVRGTLNESSARREAPHPASPRGYAATRPDLFPAKGGEKEKAPRQFQQRVEARGTLHAVGLAESPPHPALRADLSPQAGRGEIEPAAHAFLPRQARR